jgi:hypothetical protein
MGPKTIIEVINRVSFTGSLESERRHAFHLPSNPLNQGSSAFWNLIVESVVISLFTAAVMEIT